MLVAGGVWYAAKIIELSADFHSRISPDFLERAIFRLLLD